MLIHQIAKTAHEVNRAYNHYLGTPAAPEWAEAPQWQRDSAVAGVHQLFAQPDATPEFMHQCWMKRKEADGWTYGYTLDAERKTHPCLVPWADLPKAEQAKDYLFTAVVRSFL